MTAGKKERRRDSSALFLLTLHTKTHVHIDTLYTSGKVDHKFAVQKTLYTAFIPTVLRSYTLFQWREKFYSPRLFEHFW